MSHTCLLVHLFRLKNIQKHDLGLTVTVTLEKSETPCLLPLRSLVNVGQTGDVVVEDMKPTNRFVYTVLYSVESA